MPSEYVEREYLDGARKIKRPHHYPAKAKGESIGIIARVLTLIVSQYEHSWIGLLIVESVQWRESGNTALGGFVDEHNTEVDVLKFGYDKDTQTFQSLRTWLLEYIERDQMLAMTYMLRYMANSWRNIIAAWTDHLESMVGDFVVPLTTFIS